jgi:hypothetical protein
MSFYTSILLLGEQMVLQVGYIKLLHISMWWGMYPGRTISATATTTDTTTI